MPQSLFEDNGLAQKNSAALYEIWAPANSPWSQWVAPALFAQMECRDTPQISEPVAAAERHEDARQPRHRARHRLPGAECVQFALALTQIGYRPVLLINSSPGPIGPMPPTAPSGSQPPLAPPNSPAGIEVVDMRALVAEVCGGSKFMRELALPDDAPPAFILDSTRLVGNRDVSEDRFDNRWIIFPQDFPSARFLASRGIVRAVVLQRGGDRPAHGPAARSDLAGKKPESKFNRRTSPITARRRKSWWRVHPVFEWLGIAL